MSVDIAGREFAKGTSGLFDFTLSDSQKLLRDSVRRFANERLRPTAREADDIGQAPAELLEEVHALGLIQLGMPEALGGVGESRSPVSNVCVIEELARGDMSLALAALAPLGVVHALLDHGTAEQQHDYLPAFAGERFYPAALALLEPRPLFDPHRLITRASPCDGGYRITGEKAMVPLASSAQLFIVCADIEGDAQAFLIRCDTPGLAVEPEPTMGLRAAQLARLRLDQVWVPRAARLGARAENGSPRRDESRERRGIDAERLIDLGRIAWSAMAVGTCGAILEYVKSYCSQRNAFGEPITHRQSIAFAIANMAIEIDGLRLMVYRAASRAEQGKTFHREAALARVQSANKAMHIASDGVQLLGGHGFVKEHPVELWYRQLRAIGIVEGMLSV